MRAFFAIVLSLSLGACTRPAPTPAPDAAAAAPRVVSLSPSTTEALFAIGAGAVAVGRSRYCDFPPEAKALPQVGGYVDPNVEAILALRPSLVVGARGPAGSKIADTLGARGIATYFPETESLAQIDAMIQGLGARTSREAEARALVDRTRAEIAAIEERYAAKPRVRVLLVFGLEPVVVAGPKSFPDEMLRHAGGTNAVTEGPAYPTLGLERVVALDPDVVVNAAMAEERSAERLNARAPGWSSVRAVKEGRVVALGDESVIRPGPRVARGIDVLARAVHGERKE
jgi:iron complex transport system substrate-binding protein